MQLKVKAWKVNVNIWIFFSFSRLSHPSRRGSLHRRCKGSVCFQIKSWCRCMCRCHTCHSILIPVVKTAEPAHTHTHKLRIGTLLLPLVLSRVCKSACVQTSVSLITWETLKPSVTLRLPLTRFSSCVCPRQSGWLAGLQMRLQPVKEVAAVHLYCVAKMTHGDGLDHNLHCDCAAKKKKKNNT